MKKILFLLLLFCMKQSLFAQYVYTIKADSVKITNSCDTAELIIENHTQTVPGFLFNKGRGRTEFRRGLYQLNDSLYLLGGDTLNLFWALNGLNANNGLLKTGNTIQFGNDLDNPIGGPADQIRPTVYNQNSQLFCWVPGQVGVFSVYKNLVNNLTSESNVLRGYHIARFAAPIQQGGVLFESFYGGSPYAAPLSWLLFKNTNPDGATWSFFGDPYTSLMVVGQRKGVDGKYYANFKFRVAGDTIVSGNTAALRLYPSFTAVDGGPIRLPTAAIRRLDITDGFSGADDNFPALSYNNPYSRIVVDASNIPLVIGNLPITSNPGRVLVVDNDGKVWRGDSTSSLSGGVSTFSSLSTTNDKVKLTSDLTSTSSSLLGATGLSLNVNAGTYYKFKFVIVFATDATTTGIKLGLTAPTATVFSATANVATGSNDGANFHAQGSITSSGGFFATSSVDAANTGYIAIVEGIILPTASGTVQLTFGSGVNGSQVALKNGSMGSIETY